MNNIERLERLHAFAYGDSFVKTQKERFPGLNSPEALRLELMDRARGAQTMRSIRATLRAGPHRQIGVRPRNDIARMAGATAMYGGSTARSRELLNDAILRLRKK